MQKYLGILVCAILSSSSYLFASDPLESLKETLKRIEEKGTSPRVTNFVAPDKWCKRQHFMSEIKYDVTKTDSLVSPFMAKIKWNDLTYLSENFDNPSDAVKSSMKEISSSVKSKIHCWSIMAYQDDKWIVKDVGWDMPDVMSKRFSELEDYRDPLTDWWRAFGGTVDIPNNEVIYKRYLEEKTRTKDIENAVISQQETTKKAQEKKVAEEEAARWRIWSDSSGKYSVKARYSGMMNKNVQLKKEDGKTISILFEKLSKKDQDWILARKK